MTEERKTLKLAAVQASSVFLDREATVEKACALIREAGNEGADVIGFPEGFIPAHPHWYHFMPVSAPRAFELSRELFKHSVEIPSPATEALGAACRDGNIIAVVGVCERRPGTKATMYNTQVFIDRSGQLLGKHQKIMPTLGERIVHTGGFGDTLTAYQTDIGPVSGLVCGENSNPLAIFAMAAMHPVVHVAAWPAYFHAKVHMPGAVEQAGRSLGNQMGSFIINAAGVVTEDMIDAYAQTDADREFLNRVKDEGAAVIMGPNGKILAGPHPGGEGILYADAEMDDLYASGIGKDYAGHYNRFDIFNLTINRAAPKPLNFSDGAEVLPQGADTPGEAADVLSFEDAGVKSGRG